MTIALIAFLIYTSYIFFIKEYIILGFVFLINLILMGLLKVNLKKAFFFILKLMPFILFTGILNILLGDLSLGILISIRLILVCNITYIFSSKMTPKKLESSIEKLLFPLKIFKVNTRNIGIMVSIAIAFIPIFQREVQNLKYSLSAKGFKMNLKNFIKKPSLILMPIISSTIKKTTEIEQSMLAKGYIS